MQSLTPQHQLRERLGRRQRELEAPEPEGEPWLEKQLHLLRDDPGALGRFLVDEVAPWQRLQARLILTRELGARQAAAIVERWFGIGRAELPGDGASPAWALLDPSRAQAFDEAGALAHPRLQPAIERRAAMIYRRALDDGSVDRTHPALLSALGRQRAGQPLPIKLHQRLAARLGADFSRVRVHSDEVAAEAALAVRASAFTLGEDLFFAEGAWAPHTGEGQARLAHELEQVVQWQGESDFDRGARGAAVEIPYRRAMERFYGADFSRVRAHLGRPSEMQALGAQAATRGEEIVFAEADPSPELVAHELAHVVQHRVAGGEVRGPDAVSRPDDTAEREAHSAAQRFLQGAPAPSLSALSSGSNIHRETGGAQTAIDLVTTYAPALAKLLAERLPELAPASLLEAATGLLARLPVLQSLPPEALAALAAGAGQLYRAYQKEQADMSFLDRAKEAIHETVPSSLSSLASAVLPATMFAGVLPATVGSAIPVAIAWGVYLGFRRALPQRGSMPQVGDHLSLCGGFLDLEITESARPWFGYFDVTAQVKKGGDLKLDWLNAEGTVKLSMVDRAKIVGIADASALKLDIGGFVLSDLEVTREVRFGLEITGGKLADPWGQTAPIRAPITVTSGGWLSGEARMSGGKLPGNDLETYGYRVRFGPTWPQGVELDLDLCFLVSQDQLTGELEGVRPTATHPLEIVRHPVSLMVPSFYEQNLDLDSCFLTATQDSLILDSEGDRNGERVGYTATGVKGIWKFDFKPLQKQDKKPKQDSQKDSASRDQPKDEPSPKTLGGKSLLSSLHDLFTGKLGPVTKGFLKVTHGAVQALSYVKPASPDSVDTTPAQAPEQPQSGGWMSWIDPRQYGFAKALDGLTIPDFGGHLPTLPRLSFSNLRFSAEDLGGKLMIRGGGSLTVTLPGEENRPGPKGTGDLELRWFPFDAPYIVLLAQVTSDLVKLDGIEADPDDGVRLARGVATLPLPPALSKDGSFIATAHFLQLGHGFGFRELSGSLQNLSIPEERGADDLYVHVVDFHIGANAGARGPRYQVGGKAELRNLTRTGDAYEGRAQVAWGGGEGVALQAGASTDLKIGNWLRATQAGVDVWYGKDGLGGSIDTENLVLTPGFGFEFNLQKGHLQVGKKGLVGTTLTGLDTEWKGLGVRLDSLAILQGGKFKATGLSLVVTPSKLADLPFLEEMGWKAPDWLQDVKLRVGIDIDGTGEQVKISRPRFGVVAAGVRLFGLGGFLDLEKGTAGLRLYKSGTFRPTAQFPVHPGVGVEIGGLIRYRVGLEGDAKITGATAAEPDAPLGIQGGINLRGSLEGSIVAGAFGGVPGVFTVGGGLHAGVKIAIEALARVDGSLLLPGKSAPRGAGHFGFDFAVKGPGDKPATASVIAGPYIFVDFAGLSKTLKLNLLDAPLLQLEAYGGLLLDAPPRGGVDDEHGRHLRTIPDPFPVYRVQVHEDLKKIFRTGKNALLEHRIRQAERNLAKGFAKVSAVDHRIDEEQQIKKGAKEGELYASDEEELASATSLEKKTGQGRDGVQKEIEDTEKLITEWNKLQDYLRRKLRRYQWQLASANGEPSFLESAKHYGLEATKDSLGHLKDLELPQAVAAFKKGKKGRAPSQLADTGERLQQDHHGTEKKKELTVEDLALKIKHKEIEIEYAGKQIEETGAKLARLESNTSEQQTSHEEAQYALLKAQTVVALHELPLEEDYQADKQQEQERHEKVAQELKVKRQESISEVKSGKLTSVKGIVSSAVHGIGELATHAKTEGKRAVTADKDKSLERYKDGEEIKLKEAWDNANHVYRIVARRRVYEDAHLKKRLEELKSIDARILELKEQKANTKPQPPTPEQKELKQELPESVTNGPAFSIGFELGFWERRKDQVKEDIAQLEKRLEESVEMSDPTKKLTGEQREMLAGAAEKTGGAEHTNKQQAELDRKQKDVLDANLRLDDAREAAAKIENDLEELRELIKALEKLADEKSQLRSKALQLELPELEKKLKLRDTKVKQCQILADAAGDALSLTSASLQRQAIE